MSKKVMRLCVVFLLFGWTTVLFARPETPMRHALVLDDVQDAELNGVACMPATGTNALMRLSQTSNVLIRGSQPQSAEGAFLKVDGADSCNVALLGNDFGRVARIVELGDGVPAGAVRQAGNLDPSPPIR